MWRTFKQGRAPDGEEFLLLVGGVIHFARFEDGQLLVSDVHLGTYEPNKKIYQGSLSVFRNECEQSYGLEPRWQLIELPSGENNG